MVGGRDYDDQPVQPRHRGRAPAGVGVQGVRPRGRARARDLPLLGVELQAEGVRRPQLRAAPNGSWSTTTKAPTRARTRSSARRPSRTTRSTRKSASTSAPHKIALLAHRMGITTPLSTNPAMTIGGLTVGVTPLDMAHAYETIAHNGERVSGTMTQGGQPVGIQEVKAGSQPLPDGSRTDRNKVTTTRVLPPSVAQTETSMLETVLQYGTGRAAAIGQFAAGKTGTTSNYGDAWFVGWNSKYTVAVWVGYPEKLVPMSTHFNGGPVLGGTFPALIWHDFMTSALAIEAERAANSGHSAPPGRNSRRAAAEPEAASSGGKTLLEEALEVLLPAAANTRPAPAEHTAAPAPTPAPAHEAPPAPPSTSPPPACRASAPLLRRGRSRRRERALSNAPRYRRPRGPRRSTRAMTRGLAAATRCGSPATAEAPRQLDRAGDPHARALHDLRLRHGAPARARASVPAPRSLPLRSSPIPSACVSFPAPSRAPARAPASRAARASARSRVSAPAPGSARPRRRPRARRRRSASRGCRRSGTRTRAPARRTACACAASARRRRGRRARSRGRPRSRRSRPRRRRARPCSRSARGPPRATGRS